MIEMARFDWSDPFNFDDQLTEEERMVRDAAHGFAQGELQPRVINAFREELDAAELFPLMGQAGLLGATIPQSYGGAGAGYVSYGLIAREIERKSALPCVNETTMAARGGAPVAGHIQYPRPLAQQQRSVDRQFFRVAG